MRFNAFASTSPTCRKKRKRTKMAIPRASCKRNAMSNMRNENVMKEKPHNIDEKREDYSMVWHRNQNFRIRADCRCYLMFESQRICHYKKKISIVDSFSAPSSWIVIILFIKFILCYWLLCTESSVGTMAAAMQCNLPIIKTIYAIKQVIEYK